MSEPCGDSVPCVRVVIDFDDDYSPPSPIPQLPFSLPTSPLMPDDGEETVEESPAGSRDGESECIVSPREERLRRREAFTAQARHLDPQKDPCNAGVASGSEAFRGGAQSSCGGGDCAESGDQAIYNSVVCVGFVRAGDEAAAGYLPGTGGNWNCHEAEEAVHEVPTYGTQVRVDCRCRESVVVVLLTSIARCLQPATTCSANSRESIYTICI